MPQSRTAASRALQDKTFLLLLVSVTVAFAWILWPYFGAILWACILAVLFVPLHRRLCIRLRERRSLAALLTLLAVLLIVIVPGVLIGAMLIQQGSSVYARIHSGQIDLGALADRAFAGMPGWITPMLDGYGLTDLSSVREKFSAGMSKGFQFFAARALNIGQNTLEFVVAFGVMLYLLFFLLRDGSFLAARAQRAIPLREDLQHDLAEKFATVIRATVKGNIVVALVQGALGGLAFWFLGVAPALLWAVVMAFLSLLPAVGTALVWAPVAVYLLATGATWQGVALIAYGVLVIGVVDNVLRPLLVGKDTRMPDYVVLLSTLGGMTVFGFNGFVIGPIVAAMFIAVWDTLAGREDERAPAAG